MPRVTVLEPTSYTENLSGPWAAERIARAAYPVPVEAPMWWVATADVAGAVERALDRRDGPVRAARRADDPPCVRCRARRRAGTPVRWQTMSPDEYADRLRRTSAATPPDDRSPSNDSGTPVPLGLTSRDHAAGLAARYGEPNPWINRSDCVAETLWRV